MFLLFIVSLNSVTFAPTPFPTAEACKVAARAVADKIAAAPVNANGATVSCIPVEARS